MQFVWDESKRQANLKKHGFDFADAEELFNPKQPLVSEDTRFDYGEPRFQALGELRGVVVLLVFTPREEALRIISLRRANKKERGIYAEAQKRLETR